MNKLSLLAAAFFTAFAQNGVVPEEPFRFVDFTPTPADVEEFLGKESSKLTVDGRILTFMARSKAQQLFLTGGIQVPLKKIADSEVFVVRLERPTWDEAIVSWAPFDPQNPKVDKMNVWRGSRAPTLPDLSVAPTTLIRHEMKSVHLGEKRTIHVYLPRRRGSDLPVIIMADGQGTEPYARILEAMIEAGVCRPVALVGLENGGYRGPAETEFDPKQDYRAKEYVESEDPIRFKQHAEWVLKEVLPWVRKTHSISSKRSDTGLFGFSNGGAWAAAMGIRYGDQFGFALPFSVGAPPSVKLASSIKTSFYFVAGELESGFLRGTKKIESEAKAMGAETHLQTYVAGHDGAMWQVGFARVVKSLFPAR